MKKISVLGLGYMGLPMAAILATKGFEVLGVDINKKKVEEVNKGLCPFDEPGLKELVKKANQSKKLTATTKIQPANVFIISVPTPHKGVKADLTYVKAATQMISKVLEDGNLVILESTVSPKTCQDLIAPILDKTNKKYYLSHCPERAIPGYTLKEMVNNDRIIGGANKKSTQLTKNIYKKFVKGKILETDLITAECCKLMENTYRDVNIALANEFSQIAEELDMDIWEAIKMANHHPRVNIHTPGPGVGGHCIAIDPWFLVEKTKSGDLIRLSRKINDQTPQKIVNKINKISKKYKLKKIGIFGVAYKKNVDDARETPAQYIIEGLKKAKKNLKITDPYVEDFDYKLENANTVLNWCDLAVIITDHDDYKKLNWKKNNIKKIFDTRGLLKGDKIINLSGKI